MSLMRKIFLGIVITSLISIVALLCLMDLPWNSIIKFIKEKYFDKEDDLSDDKKDEEQQEKDDDFDEANKRNNVCNKETEILKKLQKAIRSKTSLDFQTSQRPISAL